MRPHGGASCFSGSVVRGEAFPFTQKDNACPPVVLALFCVHWSFPKLLCPPRWQPPAAPGPGYSQGRREVKDVCSHVTLYPSTIHSGHISWAGRQLSAHLRIRVALGPGLPETGWGRGSLWAVKSGEP